MSETTGKSIKYTMHDFVQQGWQCPVCKRILAPFMTECPCQGQGMQTLTIAHLEVKDE